MCQQCRRQYSTQFEGVSFRVLSSFCDLEQDLLDWRQAITTTPRAIEIQGRRYVEDEIFFLDALAALMDWSEPTSFCWMFFVDDCLGDWAQKIPLGAPPQKESVDWGNTKVIA